MISLPFAARPSRGRVARPDIACWGARRYGDRIAPSTESIIGVRGLEDQHDHRCRTLSSGQQRRVDRAVGIIASGIISTSFNNLTISMAFERQTGVLKRLAGTPNLGIGVLVLTAWLVGAFVLTLRTFGFVDDR